MKENLGEWGSAIELNEAERKKWRKRNEERMKKRNEWIRKVKQNEMNNRIWKKKRMIKNE